MCIRDRLDAGVDVYLIDWGYADADDQQLTLADYVHRYIGHCVDHLRESRHLAAINLLGVCQGGALSLCFAALYPEKIRNLVAMVTPVDFHVQGAGGCGLLNSWCRAMDPDLMVQAFGNVPGDFMNYGYLMLRPFQLNVGKYLSLLDIADDEAKLLNFLRSDDILQPYRRGGATGFSIAGVICSTGVTG